MPLQHWESTLPLQPTGQEEQGHKVHLDTLYLRDCHLAGCAQPHTPTQSTRQLHCCRQSHPQETNPAAPALPLPQLPVTSLLSPLALLSCQTLSQHRQWDRSPAHAQGTVGAQAQVYLCPGSVSCHCHGAPEPHRSQLRHRWEQQL